MNVKDNNGNTALILAISNPKANSIVSALIKASKDLNIDMQDDKYGLTALMWAVNSGQASVIKTLIEAGAAVNIKDKQGKRAVDYARENESLKGTAAFKKLEELSK